MTGIRRASNFSKCRIVNCYDSERLLNSDVFAFFIPTVHCCQPCWRNLLQPGRSGTAGIRSCHWLILSEPRLIFSGLIPGLIEVARGRIPTQRIYGALPSHHSTVATIFQGWAELMVIASYSGFSETSTSVWS